MIPDGIYDNRATMEREEWKDDAPTCGISAILLKDEMCRKHLPTHWQKPWGEFPDLPITSWQCPACKWVITDVEYLAIRSNAPCPRCRGPLLSNFQRGPPV